MKVTTQIAGTDYFVEGLPKAVNMFLKIKKAVEKGYESGIVLEKTRPGEREPDQELEVYGLGIVFVTGGIESEVLKVELPLE